MAELSDADKKVLLGDDYKRAQARKDAERGITDETRDVKRREEAADGIVAISLALAFVAFLIGLANYFSRGTPFNSTLVIGCAILTIASVASAAWFRRQRKLVRESNLNKERR